MGQVRVALVVLGLGLFACGGKLAPADDTDPITLPGKKPVPGRGADPVPGKTSPGNPGKPGGEPGPGQGDQDDDYDPGKIVQTGPSPKPPPGPTSEPQPLPSPPPPLPPVGATPEDWTWIAAPFKHEPTKTECQSGKQFLRFSARYKLWVGVELCSPTRYKIWLGDAKDGLFHEITDGAGGGEDHCELVNPKFTIPNEDDITSGGCKTCDNGFVWGRGAGDLDYFRARFGEPFRLEKWPDVNHYTSTWYECGVSIP